MRMKEELYRLEEERSDREYKMYSDVKAYDIIVTRKKNYIAKAKITAKKNKLQEELTRLENSRNPYIWNDFLEHDIRVIRAKIKVLDEKLAKIQ